MSGKVPHGNTTLVMSGLELKKNNDLIARASFEEALAQWSTINSFEFELWITKRIEDLQ